MVIRRRLKAVKNVWGGEFKKLSAKARADLSKDMRKISKKTGELSAYRMNNEWNKAESEVKRLTGVVQNRDRTLYRLRRDKESELKRHIDDLLYSPTLKEAQAFFPKKRDIAKYYNDRIKRFKQILRQDKQRLKKNKKIMQKIETSINLNLIAKQWAPMIAKTPFRLGKDIIGALTKSVVKTPIAIVKPKPPKKQSFGIIISGAKARQVARASAKDLIKRGRDAKRALSRNKGKLPRKMSKSLKKSANKNIRQGYKDLTKLKIKGVTERTLRILTAPIRRPLAKQQFAQNKTTVDRLTKEISADDKKLAKVINQFNKKYSAETFFNPKKIAGMDRKAVKAAGLERRKALEAVYTAELTLNEKRAALQALQQRQVAIGNIINPPYQAAARARIERGRRQLDAVQKNIDNPKQAIALIKQGTRTLMGGYKDLAIARVKRVTQPTIKALIKPINKITAPRSITKTRKKVVELHNELTMDRWHLNNRTQAFNQKYPGFLNTGRTEGLSQKEINKQAAARARELNIIQEDRIRIAEKQIILDRYQEKLNYLLKLIK